MYVCRQGSEKGVFSTAKHRSSGEAVVANNRTKGERAWFVSSIAPSLQLALALCPDIGGAGATGITHLVSTSGTSWLFAKVNIEIIVDLQAAVLGVTINLQQVGTSLRDIRVELIVPRAIERVGDVQSLAIKAQLEHLRATAQLVTPGSAAFRKQATAPHLSSQSRV